MPLRSFLKRRENAPLSGEQNSTELFDPRSALAADLNHYGGSVRSILGTVGNTGKGELLEEKTLHFEAEKTGKNMTPLVLVGDQRIFGDKHVEYEQTEIALTIKIGTKAIKQVIKFENGHLASEESMERTDGKEPVPLATVKSYQNGIETSGPQTTKPLGFLLFVGSDLERGDLKIGAIEYLQAG